MTPIKIVFQSKESITVYSDDPGGFTDSIRDSKPPDIASLEYVDENAVSVPELTEVQLTLRSGAIVLCQIAKTDVAKTDFIEEIEGCDASNVIAYNKLARLENELDTRFASASAVINNIPDLPFRLELHKAYLKRKQAYVSAIEALVDGALRRPTE